MVDKAYSPRVDLYDLFLEFLEPRDNNYNIKSRIHFIFIYDLNEYIQVSGNQYIIINIYIYIYIYINHYYHYYFI